jgi:hypothetical protein
MRERGRYQLQLMKTRNSSGVGQKIDLGFDVDTLRIVDIGEDEDSGYNSAPSNGTSVLDNIKRGGGTTTPADTVNDDPSDGATVGKIRAQTDSTKLKQFLNNLGDE